MKSTWTHTVQYGPSDTLSSTAALWLPKQASDFQVLTVPCTHLHKQQLPLSIFWSRAKAQRGMVESWQRKGANDGTLGTESGEYRGTNKSAEGVKYLSLGWRVRSIYQRDYGLTWLRLH